MQSRYFWLGWGRLSGICAILVVREVAGQGSLEQREVVQPDKGQEHSPPGVVGRGNCGNPCLAPCEQQLLRLNFAIAWQGVGRKRV